MGVEIFFAILLLVTGVLGCIGTLLLFFEFMGEEGDDTIGCLFVICGCVSPFILIAGILDLSSIVHRAMHYA